MRGQRGHLALVLAVATAALGAAPTAAGARTWRVPLDAGTVAAAVDSAAAGDTVQIAAGTYAEHGIALKPGLLVRGVEGAPDRVVLDAGGTGRVFALAANEGTTELADLTLTGGLADGAGFPGAAGGALIANAPLPGSVLRLSRCWITGNEANGPGGGLCVENMDLLLEECEIAGNRSGIASTWAAGAGVFFRRSLGGEWGVWSDSLLVRVERCRFIENVAQIDSVEDAADGGGLQVSGDNNEARVRVQVEECLFEDNFADQGAGLYVGRFTVGDILRSVFRRNTAFQHGGAAAKGGRPFYTLGEVARFEYCLFEDNRAGYDAGGAPTPVSAGGGAFYIRRLPRARFFNCTFVGNQAGGTISRGDAIYQTYESQFFPDSSRCRLVNCVFWGPDGNDVQVRSDPQGFELVSHNAMEPGEFVCTAVVPVHEVTLLASPFVGTGDFHLLPDSPCVDAGMFRGRNHDLDGVYVPQLSGTDIGAYEVLQYTGVPDGGRAPGVLRRLSVFPNPFNPRTEIVCELARPARVVVDVYDLAGRRVAALADRELPAGVHRLRWDGRDGFGRGLPAAAYLLRLRAGDRMVTRKLLLVK